MSAAEGKAVVEQDAAVGDVQCLNVDRELLTETLSQRKVKGGVRLQVAWWRTAAGESRGIVDVGRSVGVEWEIVPTAEVQRVALVVVEVEISRRRHGASTNQTADDAATAKRQLIRIREIELGAIAEPWRAESQLPAIDSRAVYIDGEEDVGVIQTVVIEEVGGASQKVVGIQYPAFEGNGHTELVLFIAFAGQPCKIQLLLASDRVESRARQRAERRRLIKMSVKTSEHPVELGNS